MYKLTDQTIREAQTQDIYQGTTWGNFNAFISRQPISERQAEGWYSTLVQGDVSVPTADAENDCIIIPIPVPVPEGPFDISKLKLKRAMVALGKWEDFLNVLKTDASAYEDFNLAVTLMSDDPLVVQFKQVCIQMFGLTEEQIDEMLKQCKSDI